VSHIAPEVDSASQLVFVEASPLEHAEALQIGLRVTVTGAANHPE